MGHYIVENGLPFYLNIGVVSDVEFRGFEAFRTSDLVVRAVRRNKVRQI